MAEGGRGEIPDRAAAAAAAGVLSTFYVLICRADRCKIHFQSSYSDNIENKIFYVLNLMKGCAQQLVVFGCVLGNKLPQHFTGMASLLYAL